MRIEYSLPARRICVHAWLTAWRCNAEHQQANQHFSWQPEPHILELLENLDAPVLQGVARALWRVAADAHWVIADPKYPLNEFQYVDTVAHILPGGGGLPDWLTQGPPHVIGMAPTTSKEMRFAIYAHAAAALRGACGFLSMLTAVMVHCVSFVGVVLP